MWTVEYAPKVVKALERTRERRTKTVSIRVTIPARKKAEAIEAIERLGYVVDEAAIPWREVFPDITDMELPGRILRGARYREGISQVKLSELTGIPQRHISEMETGKRPIGKNNAIKIGKALNLASYKILL